MATSSSLLGDALDEASALRELALLLGPLPQEWIDSLGTVTLFWVISKILTKSAGESFSVSGRDTSLLEGKVRSLSEVGDTSRLIALLRRALVLEPVRRPDVSDVLDDPWFVAAAPSGSASA